MPRMKKNKGARTIALSPTLTLIISDTHPMPLRIGEIWMTELAWESFKEVAVREYMEEHPFDAYKLSAQHLSNRNEAYRKRIHDTAHKLEDVISQLVSAKHTLEGIPNE